MEEKKRRQGPILLQGIASVLNRCGTAVVVTHTAGITSIEKICNAVKETLSTAKNTRERSDKTNRLTDLLLLTGTSIPAIRKNVREMIEEYQTKGSGESNRLISSKVSNKLIKRSALKSGGFGGLSAVPGMLPGIGTLGTMVVCLTADLIQLLRTQIELCYGIAAAYDVDMDEEELQAVALALIGFSGTAEALKGISATVIREAIDKAATRHLQTGISKVASILARKLGLETSSKMTRLIPLIGIPLCTSINIATTMKVGTQAKKYFSTWNETLDQLPGYANALT